MGSLKYPGLSVKWRGKLHLTGLLSSLNWCNNTLGFSVGKSQKLSNQKPFYFVNPLHLLVSLHLLRDNCAEPTSCLVCHWSLRFTSTAKFFCLFLWLYINVLRDVGECCESVPLDHTGSYVSISINITKILACVVQVDAFIISLVTSAL